MNNERELIDGEPYTIIDGEVVTMAETLTGSRYYEYVDGNPRNNRHHNICVLTKEQWEDKRRARGNN